MLREGPASDVIAIDGTAEVQLPESPSTGYRWHLDDLSNGVTTVDTAYHDGSASPLAGGTGIRVFRLRLDPPDRARQLTFLLRRPWEAPELAIERRIVSVTPS